MPTSHLSSSEEPVTAIEPLEPVTEAGAELPDVIANILGCDPQELRPNRHG